MSPASDARLGPYEVLGLLGAGGMGEVHRGRDPRLGRQVAIKILPAAFSTDPDRLHRFEQEARSAAALNHPNIVAVYDIGQHNGSPYIVSELLEGETLRARLEGGSPAARQADGSSAAQRPLPVRRAVDYAVQIAHGLAAAHDKGIIHRDLKPELSRVVDRCLEKDPQARFQSTRDLAFALEGLSARSEPHAAAIGSVHRTPWLPWALFAAATVALVAASLLALSYYRRPAERARTVRFLLELPGVMMTLWHQYDVARDGRFLVNTPESVNTPVTIVVDWPALMKR